MRRIRLLLGVFFSCALCGCGSNNNSNALHLSGAATYGGQPIPYGVLIFNPDSREKHTGLQGYSTIEDGRFDTRSGTAITPGPYVITVIGYKEKPDLSGDETNNKAGAAVPLFPDYTTRLTLKSAQQDIDVPESWPSKSRR